MPWIAITTEKQQYDFDLSKEELDTVWEALVAIMLQSGEGGYLKLPASKDSVTLFPGNVLRKSIIQIGGIQ